ncbi:carbohydrate ABC transporter permease [Planctomycetota bacterium]
MTSAEQHVPSRRWRWLRRAFTGYAFASPWLFGFFALTLGPMVLSFLLAFVKWDGISFEGIDWVGLGNYRRAWADPDVKTALSNTAYYSFLSVPMGLCVSLALAMLLNQKLRGIALFRTIFYMPSVIGGVATIMMWTWVFNPDYGLLNGALRWLLSVVAVAVPGAARLELPRWLMEEQWAKPSLILMHLWGAGGAMLIFLAALQNVPDSLYEAADIDGAGRLRKFIHITVPQISPAIFFNLIMGIIGSFQVFAQAFLMTNGGPNKATLFYVLYLYNKAFQDFEFGYASALAWILFVIIMFFTLLVLRSSKVWVYYEGE